MYIIVFGKKRFLKRALFCTMKTGGITNEMYAYERLNGRKPILWRLITSKRLIRKYYCATHSTALDAQLLFGGSYSLDTCR